MNIVVFGSSGYIGSHLVEKLLYDGHKVLALVHRGNGLLTANSINHKNITVKKIVKFLNDFTLKGCTNFQGTNVKIDKMIITIKFIHSLVSICQ